MAVATQRRENHLFLTRLLAPQRFGDALGEGVGRFGGGHDAFGAGELDARRETLRLRFGDGLHEAELVDVADEGRHAVVAEPTGVDGVGHEVVTEGVHLHERRESSGVAEVVGVVPTGEART